MTDDELESWFRAEESAALLREIYPNYPNLDDRRPVPDPREFLRRYRAERKSPGDGDDREAIVGA